MAEHPLEDLAARLDRERQEADRAYNDALTALDRALKPVGAPPHRPVAIDAAPVAVESGRPSGLRALLWRVLGPPPDSFTRLNALTDRANRLSAAERELALIVAALIDYVRDEMGAIERFDSRLINYLQTITAYVDTRDRAIASADPRERLSLLEQRLATMKRALETRGPATAEPAPAGGVFSSALDSATYVGFEDRFRGAREEIRRRVDDYVPLLAGCTDVVDIGCGRGELLALLKSKGIAARGVDGNHAMADLCRTQGLDVEQGDGLRFLESQPDGSIGGLTAIQVVEHFEPAYLAQFLETAFHKLRSGAPIILETINPACWMAFFETYIRDLTHQRPLHPETLKYLVEASGFTQAAVQYRSPVTDGDRLATVPAVRGTDVEGSLAAAINDHATKLNQRLFSSMDYVVVGRR